MLCSQVDLSREGRGGASRASELFTRGSCHPLAWPHAGGFQLLHQAVGELGARRIDADHDISIVSWSGRGGDILEPWLMAPGGNEIAIAKHCASSIEIAPATICSTFVLDQGVDHSFG
jgi:hypothetical protein